MWRAGSRITQFFVVLGLTSFGAACGESDSWSADELSSLTGSSEDGGAGDDRPTTGNDATGPTVAAPTGTGAPHGGITEDEAEDSGVATGRYDALLEGPIRARERPDGCAEVTFRLTNVGQDADSYVTTGNSAVTSIEPDQPVLGPDESVDIVVVACDGSSGEVVVDVHSNGLGEIVARGGS